MLVAVEVLVEGRAAGGGMAAPVKPGGGVSRARRGAAGGGRGTRHRGPGRDPVRPQEREKLFLVVPT